MKSLACAGLWLLETLESLEGNLSPQLIAWADSFRMLLRVAPPEHYAMLGELAGLHLAGLLNIKGDS